MTKPEHRAVLECAARRGRLNRAIHDPSVRGSEPQRAIVLPAVTPAIVLPAVTPVPAPPRETPAVCLVDVRALQALPVDLPPMAGDFFEYY